MENRRMFLRFGCSRKARISFPNLDKKEDVQGELLDFSRQGAKLALFKCTWAKCGDYLKIKTYLPDEHIPITFYGKAKWVRQNNDLQEVGLSLEEISAASKEEILGHVYAQWRHGAFV